MIITKCKQNEPRKKYRFVIRYPQLNPKMADQCGNYCSWGDDIGLASEFMSDSTGSKLVYNF